MKFANTATTVLRDRAMQQYRTFFAVRWRLEARKERGTPHSHSGGDDGRMFALSRGCVSEPCLARSSCGKVKQSCLGPIPLAGFEVTIEDQVAICTVSIMARMFSSGVPAWTLWQEQQM